MMRNRFRLLAVLMAGIISIPCFSQKEEPYKRLNTASQSIYDICFSEHGSVLAVADFTAIKVFDPGSGELIREFENGHTAQILSIDISRDSTLLISGGKDSTVVIRDFLTGRIIDTFNYNGIVTDVCLSPDSRFLACGGSDNELYVYDLEKKNILNVFSDPKEDITSLAFSENGRYLAASSGDKRIYIYANGSLAARLEGHTNWVRDISFCEYDTRLISCGDDAKVITWNISEIKNPKILNVSSYGLSWFLCLDSYEDLETIAVGEVKGMARIIANFGIYTLNVKSSVNKIKFQPGKGIYLSIAVATLGKGVMLIDAKDMKSKYY